MDGSGIWRGPFETDILRRLQVASPAPFAIATTDHDYYLARDAGFPFHEIVVTRFSLGFAFCFADFSFFRLDAGRRHTPA